MNLRRFDLPLHQSAASRFLPWTIGGLLYLAVVALAVAGVADEALRLYGMRTKLVTVSLPSIEDAGRGEREMAAAIEMLNGTRGVISAVPVPPEELEALVEPWLGTAKANVDLPLPRLIDVTLDPQAKPDLPALQARLGAVIQGATIGIEALSRDRAERLAPVLQGVEPRRRDRGVAGHARVRRADHACEPAHEQPRTSSSCAFWAPRIAIWPASSSAMLCSAACRAA